MDKVNIDLVVHIPAENTELPSVNKYFPTKGNDGHWVIDVKLGSYYAGPTPSSTYFYFVSFLKGPGGRQPRLRRTPNRVS